jgi:hypothetical protein
MASQHGKAAVLTAGAKDISPWTKTSTFERTGATHNTTGYGVDDETYTGGLRSGKFTASGWYDTTASTGTRAALGGKEGTSMTIVRKLEGNGTGKPQDTFTGVLEKYVETEPHDDIVTWSADWQISGPVATIAQA